MSGKVKCGFRFYCAIVAALTLVMGMSVTAFAAGGDPIQVVNNLSDFIFGLIRAIGLILLGFGYRSGRSFAQISRSVSEGKRLSDFGGRRYHYLRKRNPYPDYGLID